PLSARFPYTTLFRSLDEDVADVPGGVTLEQLEVRTLFPQVGDEDPPLADLGMIGVHVVAHDEARTGHEISGQQVFAHRRRARVVDRKSTRLNSSHVK